MKDLEYLNSLIKDTQNVVQDNFDSNLEDVLDRWAWQLEGEGTDYNAADYKSDLGKFMYLDILRKALDSVQNTASDPVFEAVKAAFGAWEDKRALMGHVLKIVRKNPDLSAKLKQNAEAVVLILSKKHLNLPEHIGVQRTLNYPSVPCRELLDFGFSDQAFSGVMICDEMHYDKEKVPNTDIFGSGCFIQKNIVLTAAHVLEAIAERGIDTKDLIFISGFYTDDKEKKPLLEPGKIYCLDQENLLQNDQTIYGEQGDIAWLRVKPLYEKSNQAFDIQPVVYTGTEPRLTHSDTEADFPPVYAIGHGLGTSAKLSFKGQLESVKKHNWFGCNIDVYYGNSGSPIFDAHTQTLWGIVSGPNLVKIEKIENPQPCLMIKTDNNGAKSVLCSKVSTIIKTIPNE